jgi:group II intron reverse transcriptase/maturase
MEAARAAEIGPPGLLTPAVQKVQKLQKSLHAKAKAEVGYRFYSLWDKVHREDILDEAWRLCRRNGGAPGVDGEDFKAIEAQGRSAWLANLRKELKAKAYAPQPLRRVWIPKANGKLRPLGIPTVRDRVVQAATLLVLQPIFEADLLPEQYGFRPGLDAKAAVRRAFFHITKDRRTEVVDVDLKDYFNAIPHSPLMRCVARRVADKQVLKAIKQWLGTPVMERTRRGWVRTTEARDTGRGTPQGGVISPLLANLYFRRFALAWRRSEVARKADAHLVNYADDFVLCCRPGYGDVVLAKMRELMGKLGLTVNEEKTRLVGLPEGSFDFLGYTFGQQYGRGGKPYLGTRPSRKALSRVLRRIHEETSVRWNTTTPEKRVEEVNRVLRGWCGYFDQGPVFKAYRVLRRYTEWRLRRWMMKKRGRRGTGYRQYPDEYLYGTLGLYLPWTQKRQPAVGEGV